jgi:hypothetical protein
MRAPHTSHPTPHKHANAHQQRSNVLASLLHRPTPLQNHHWQPCPSCCQRRKQAGRPTADNGGKTAVITRIMATRSQQHEPQDVARCAHNTAASPHIQPLSATLTRMPCIRATNITRCVHALTPRSHLPTTTTGCCWGAWRSIPSAFGGPGSHSGCCGVGAAGGCAREVCGFDALLLAGVAGIHSNWPADGASNVPPAAASAAPSTSNTYTQRFSALRLWCSVLERV